MRSQNRQPEATNRTKSRTQGGHSPRRSGSDNDSGRAPRPLAGLGTAEAYANCRFYVDIGERAQAVFTGLSGLEVEVETQEIKEGGNNSFIHRLPGRVSVGNITLKAGLTAGHDLYGWFRNICRGDIDKRNISVRMFDTQGRELARWNFAKAYPVRWVGPEFAADGALAAVEELELAHEGLVDTK